MIASHKWHTIYDEIRLLMQAEFWVAANEAVTELYEESSYPSHYKVCEDLRATCEAKIREQLK